MPDSTPSPPASTDHHRKRVARACEGCRLRKSKCDGRTPCCKCKANNIICTVWKSSRPKDKVYPKGYVEVLEGQRLQLIAGLQEAYRRLLAKDAWPGEKLSEDSGQPLVHDILLALNVLQTSQDESKMEVLQSGGEYHDTSSDTPEDSGSLPKAADITVNSSGQSSSDTTVRTSLSNDVKIAAGNNLAGSPKPPPRQHTLPEKRTIDQQKLLPKASTKSQNTAFDQPLSPPLSDSFERQSQQEQQFRGIPAQRSLPTLQTLPYKPVDTSSCNNSNTAFSNYAESPNTSYPQVDSGCLCPPRSDIDMLDMKHMSDPDTPCASWWMSDSVSDLQMPEVMSPSTDSLSNMLYRDICSNHFMEMYDHDFTSMPGQQQNGSAIQDA